MSYFCCNNKACLVDRGLNSKNATVQRELHYRKSHSPTTCMDCRNILRAASLKSGWSFVCSDSGHR